MNFKINKLPHYNQLPIYLVRNHLHEYSKQKDFGAHVEMIGGWGNGYVGIPVWHPFYKIDYDDLYKHTSVHGGLTFSDYDDEEDLWIIGFDTCHSGDNMYNWSYDNVLKETIKLREQCLKPKEVQRILKLNKIEKIIK